MNRPHRAEIVSRKENPAANVHWPRGFRFCNPFAILRIHSTEKDSPYMKAGIHPAYNEVKVICACGNVFTTRSTHKGDLRVEICSACHPFFTGRQKLVDTEGRVDRFQKKYANVTPRAGKGKKKELETTKA